MLIENSILYRNKRSPDAPLSVDHVWLLGLRSVIEKNNNNNSNSTIGYMNNLPCPPSVNRYEDWYDWVTYFTDMEAFDMRVYMTSYKGLTNT